MFRATKTPYEAESLAAAAVDVGFGPFVSLSARFVGRAT
jgi:hypothetical protein